MSKKKISENGTEAFDVMQNLCKLYNKKLLPLEKYYNFDQFHSTLLDEGDFTAKPLVLLIGQYSTGKTTFIRYLLEEDFPGIRIGPEPTTDRFMVVMHTDKENSTIPGQAAITDPKLPFRGLNKFGNAFLNRFQCSLINNDVLKNLTLIDTPGILSGAKQTVDRGYEFTSVIEWLAERVDMIILLFDAHKLDISDEFRRAIEAVKSFDNKIRIILNKSDMVNPQQLMKVYGALLWSLGKVLNTPEVPRVFMGSYWDRPLQFDDNRKLFQMEEQELMNELRELPSNAALRKINDLIRRARLAKVHAYIIGNLKQQMPMLLKKEKKKQELITNLDEVFHKLAVQHQVSPGDFPRVKIMQELLADVDFSTLHKLNPKMIETVDQMLSNEIPQLIQMLSKESKEKGDNFVKGGVFNNLNDDSPFGRNETGFNKGKFESGWVVSKYEPEYHKTFNTLNPNISGKLSGQAVRDHFLKSKLPVHVLSRVWQLSDVDKDGYLDIDEFSLASYLVQVTLEGEELPQNLPDHLKPPSKS